MTEYMVEKPTETPTETLAEKLAEYILSAQQVCQIKRSTKNFGIFGACALVVIICFGASLELINIYGGRRHLFQFLYHASEGALGANMGNRIKYFSHNRSN